MHLSVAALYLCTSLTAGCVPKTAVSAQVSNGASFDPIAFFHGHTQSWGVVEDRSGAPTESIVTDSDGEKDGPDRLRLVQHLSFQDGTTQERDWTLWRSGPNRFEATANDMIGTATGEVEGRLFHWEWVMARTPGNPLMNVTVNQWMYRMEDGSVTIRTTISKIGIIVAEVTEQFTHLENE